jgi:hypothetical protein
MSIEFGFGSGIMYALRNDIANQTPIRFGAFQDLSLDVSGDLKQLYGQNQYALDVARGKSKISGKAKFAQISAPIFNSAFFGSTIATGQTLAVYQEAHTVPVSGPYTAAVSNSATFSNDLGVRYAATGLPLTFVTSNPTTGQYTYSSGTYTFSTGDAGAAVLIDYEYTATSGYAFTLSNPLMGAAPRFRIDFTQLYEGSTFLFTLYSCVSSKFTLPTKVDDYAMPELDFEAYQNSSGNVMYMSSSS